MNILFLTLGHIYDLKTSDIYTDLMREFIRNGNNVFIVTLYERRLNKKTAFYESEGGHILAVKMLNIQKANILEKGLGTVLISIKYKNAIKKYLSDVKIDLVIYSTPPITLVGVVKYVKKKYKAKSYLLLKDIFPQNAVDMEMFRKSSPIYKYFRSKEKQLYMLSDFIGCMSPANVEYVLKHNPQVKSKKVGLCPNSIELWPHQPVDKYEVRKENGIPVDKILFLFGGNLGKPQGIDFFIKCLDAVKNREDCHFLIIGNGTEAGKVDAWIEQNKPKNITKIKFLPKADYYKIVASCDVGLVFVDFRFTIPNFPSRLLPYMEYKMPVICATDVNSDIGKIVEDNGFGYWFESQFVSNFVACVNKMLASDIKEMGEKAYNFLCNNYLVEHTYKAIINNV